MKNTRICPKCGGTDLATIPGGTTNHLGTSQNFIAIGFRTVAVNRHVCCTCGFSEEWIDPEKLTDVKKYWQESETN